jgi:hypothetical protein
MCLVFLLITSFAIAGEVDVLINKLVEKGVLTADEAKAVLVDTKESVKKQLAEGKLDTVPAWAQNTKFSGDVRLRYETRNFTTYENQRSRARMRLRYGFETKVNDQIMAGARLATGSTPARSSREQDMNDSFNMKSVYLDLMYMTYAPNKNLKLYGGKFSAPWYNVSTLTFDTTNNPEGVAATYKTTIKPVDVFATAAVLPLDIDTNINPVLYLGQLGGATKIFDRTLTAAVAYYFFNDISGSPYSTLAPNALTYTTNTTSTGLATTGTYSYNYRLIALDAQYPILDIKFQKKTLPLGLYGAFVKNLAGNVKRDTGWLLGFSLGATKNVGDWKFTYDYRQEEADATLDFLNEGTLHGGGTNVLGNIYTLTYQALKNTELAFSYFAGRLLSGAENPAGIERERLQLQCLVKF